MAYASWSVVFGEQPSAAKWNILGTNDAHFDSLIGSGTAWASWTPTWTNITVGNGTLVAKYGQFGKLVFFRLHLTFGSTTAVSGNSAFSPPVTANSANRGNLGIARYVDANSTDYEGFVLYSSATEFVINAGRADVANVSENALSSTVPFTWTTSDEIQVNGQYEAA